MFRESDQVRVFLLQVKTVGGKKHASTIAKFLADELKQFATSHVMAISVSSDTASFFSIYIASTWSAADVTNLLTGHRCHMSDRTLATPFNWETDQFAMARVVESHGMTGGSPLITTWLRHHCKDD